MSDLQAKLDKATAALADAGTALASAEAKQKEAQAEFESAELAAPKFSQVDLAKAMARESQARRAGLIT
jgi:hypothetical protein